MWALSGRCAERENINLFAGLKKQPLWSMRTWSRAKNAHCVRCPPQARRWKFRSKDPTNFLQQLTIKYNIFLFSQNWTKIKAKWIKNQTSSCWYKLNAKCASFQLLALCTYNTHLHMIYDCIMTYCTNKCPFFGANQLSNQFFPAPRWLFISRQHVQSRQLHTNFP